MSEGKYEQVSVCEGGRGGNKNDSEEREISINFFLVLATHRAYG